jgi:hypothetical protein
MHIQNALIGQGTFQCLVGDIYIYTTPLQKSIVARRHVEALLVALSDGPIGSASWFASDSVDSKQPRLRRSWCWTKRGQSSILLRVPCMVRCRG